MRAFQLASYDGPPGVQEADVPEPHPAGDTAVVDVHAIGINYPDLLSARKRSRS